MHENFQTLGSRDDQFLKKLSGQKRRKKRKNKICRGDGNFLF